ncbi:MAG: glycosyltransferase family 4 protein [Deltaproteobacteria bacterium]|nr:glycosyltransferase family 4 protein [Deltaproteobacteria bacterium]
MRILYLANEEIPGRMGGSVHAWEVSRGLVARGHAVTALVHLGAGQAAEETLEGVRIVRVNLKVGGKMVPLRGLRAAAGLAADADVIMERYLTQGGAGAVLSRRRSIPLVLEVNSPHVEELVWRMGWRGALLAPVTRAWVAWQFSAARIAVAPRESIVPAGARDRVRLCGWGVNVERFSPEAAATEAGRAFRNRFGLEGSTVVLFAGSFRRWHGVLDIPGISRRALARAPELKFVLLGEGDDLAEVRARVRAEGIEKNVIVAGSIPYEEMPAAVASCAIGIAPYDASAYPPLARFGFFWSPLKVFEYMACGLPVVLFGYEGLREQVGEAQRGLAVPPRDLDAFATAIVTLARDGERRRAMGEAARGHVAASHSWAGHVLWLEERLREATGEAAS